MSDIDLSKYSSSMGTSSNGSPVVKVDTSTAHRVKKETTAKKPTQEELKEAARDLNKHIRESVRSAKKESSQDELNDATDKLIDSNNDAVRDAKKKPVSSSVKSSKKKTVCAKKEEESVPGKSARTKKSKEEISKYPTHQEMIDSVNESIIKNSTKESEPLTPAEYFEKLKADMSENSTENIKLFYDTTLKELKKYMVTGQKKAAMNLYYKAESLKKELIAVEKGYTKYVSLETLENYIDNVADNCVVITELKDYERSIPDEIVDKLPDIIDVFDNFFVVFTDYTGEVRKKVQQEKREKDPILFGNININDRVSDKMYFIGDWVDEYCDLTLDQMVTDIVSKRKGMKESDIVYDITADDILEEIKGKLK